MAVYLVSSEPRGRSLQHSEEPSAGVVLCTKEYADEHTLMHYRVGGEKKGVRRWQNENGSYTKAGYEHYAEMYGWNKLRADHADRRAEINRRKASDAKLRLDKATVKYDKAEIKSNKRGDVVSAAKRDAARRKMSEAQYQYDTYSAKANKWQAKSDKIHEKWDKKQEKIAEREEKAELDKKAGTDAEPMTRTNPETGKTSNLITDMTLKGASSDELAKVEKAAEDRVENNRYVEGSRAFDENAENERRMQDFDDLSAEDKRKTGDYLLKKMSDFNDVYKYGYGEIANAKELDDLDADVAKQAVEEYKRDYGWLVTQIDRVAGNENAGEYVEGSNSEKAHQRLMKSYDESWARREELEREAGLDLTRSKNYERDHQRLKEILDSDKIYKALNEVDAKNENDLITAVLKDLGFSNTPTNRSMIFPIVFRD